MCGGQLVWPGDVIVADVSGVVAIRAANAAAVAEKAAARRLKEAEIMAGLRQGRTTIELLGLDAGEQD
jgi:4-hydroxy-4-methyl-2-oxoglutarate aldolase